MPYLPFTSFANLTAIIIDEIKQRNIAKIEQTKNKLSSISKTFNKKTHELETKENFKDALDEKKYRRLINRFCRKGQNLILQLIFLTERYV